MTRWLARVPIRRRSNHSGECGANWWDANPRSQTSTERDFLVRGGSHRHSTANTAKRYVFSTLSLRVHQTIRRAYQRIEADNGLLAQPPPQLLLQPTRPPFPRLVWLAIHRFSHIPVGLMKFCQTIPRCSRLDLSSSPKCTI